MERSNKIRGRAPHLVLVEDWSGRGQDYGVLDETDADYARRSQLLARGREAVCLQLQKKKNISKYM
jgi:hypothetical protein